MTKETEIKTAAEAVALDKIVVGISSCLLGQKVRYDAGHKKDNYVTDILAAFFKFVPVCPELEVGMGVPRESVRLEGSVEKPSMIARTSKTDWTQKMELYSQNRVRQNDLKNLSGYILKKDSPSCGMERVKIYIPGGMPVKKGRGIYNSENNGSQE